MAMSCVLGGVGSSCVHVHQQQHQRFCAAPVATTAAASPPSECSNGSCSTAGVRSRRRYQRALASAPPMALGGSAQLVQECSVQNWKSPLRCDAADAGEVSREVVVALGKFDAMHIGHRALATKASEDGCQPVLLSFSGIAQVLGLPIKLPLVAAPDRPRVLASWAPFCNGRTPRQRMVPFHEIRTMSPEAFVQVLAKELGAAGVVAGRNYRFGYKAAGDAKALQELGAKNGMRVHILDLVPDPSASPLAAAAAAAAQSSSSSSNGNGNGSSSTATAASGQQRAGEGAGVQQASSSKVRELLAAQDVQAVQQLLGRHYRLVASLPLTRHHPHPPQPEDEVLVPAQALLNMPPAPGSYVVTASLVQQPAPAAAWPAPSAGGNGNGASGGGGSNVGVVLETCQCVCEVGLQGVRLSAGASRHMLDSVRQLLALEGSSSHGGNGSSNGSTASRSAAASSLCCFLVLDFHHRAC